jgi:hypothetical protein
MLKKVIATQNVLNGSKNDENYLKKLLTKYCIGIKDVRYMYAGRNKETDLLE